MLLFHRSPVAHIDCCGSLSFFYSLLESTQVKRNGYAFRQPYAWFLQRYKMLSTVTWPHWGGVAIEGVARLLRDLPISATEYAFGRRMLFIKNDSTVYKIVIIETKAKNCLFHFVFFCFFSSLFFEVFLHYFLYLFQ